MLQSHVVEVDGVFVGAAVRQPDGYRFVAVDTRLDGIDGRLWTTLGEVRRHVRASFLVAPKRPATVAEPCLS